MSVAENDTYQPRNAVADKKADTSADSKRNERKENISQHDTYRTVPERFQTSDLRTFFLHKSHHGRQHDEKRYGDKNHH